MAMDTSIIFPSWRTYFKWKNQKVLLLELQKELKTKEVKDVQKWITGKLAELDQKINTMDVKYSQAKDAEFMRLLEETM